MVYLVKKARRLLHTPLLRHGANRKGTVSFLNDLMKRYQVSNLKNQSPQEFRQTIGEFLRMLDWEMEGFKDQKYQRDLSVKFHWGHNHDFGDFYLEGRMEDRHIDVLATFIDQLRALRKNLSGLRVLDIGCWTGGTSLLLCAMGAHVVAVEEVKKYVDCLDYLKYAFNIDNLEPKNLSIYDCVTPDFQDSFDIVLFAGVLYHITDPILALRITFNSLKDGGVCLLETASIHSSKLILSYERHKWNWFIPSPATLLQMMSDVGYTEIQVSEAIRNRTFAVGKRNAHVDMRRDGLSIINVR